MILILDDMILDVKSFSAASLMWVQRSSRTQTTNTIKYESKRESSEERRIKTKGQQIYQAAIWGKENTFPEKIEQVEAEFNGRKSMRFRYTMIEECTEQEKYLEVGKRTSEDIDSFHTEVSPALAENFGLQ